MQPAVQVELVQLALVHAQVLLHHSCDALSKFEVFEAAGLYSCMAACLPGHAYVMQCPLSPLQARFDRGDS